MRSVLHQPRLKVVPSCLQAGKGIADKVAALLHYWEGKYKHLWEQDKDAYMRCAFGRNPDLGEN